MVTNNLRLRLSLLLLRYSVALVFVMWTIDKIIRTEHAAGVFSHFYFLKDVAPTLMKSIGILELLLIAAFLIGWKKRATYGLIAVFHCISTVSSYRQFADPFSGTNLLFFASWPMLAAAIALYLLREEDTLLAVKR